MIKIATWNINSIRLRMPLLKQLANNFQPDIICLQETKVSDELFPISEIKNFGYNHIAFKGQKSYNGVAILSKIELADCYSLNLAEINDCRHICVTLPNKIKLHNLYIPAGGDEPDPIINPKFAHKLNVLEFLTSWFKNNSSSDEKIILTGDFNIAPFENDVWSHKQLLNVVSHTPIEVTKLNLLQQSLDWIDCSRHFVSTNEKLYSWWSYRNRDWQKSNRGRRLDHIWVTPNLKEQLSSHQIIKDARNWNTPSDHVPVILELDNIN